MTDVGPPDCATKRFPISSSIIFQLLPRRAEAYQLSMFGSPSKTERNHANETGLCQRGNRKEIAYPCIAAARTGLTVQRKTQPCAQHLRNLMNMDWTHLLRNWLWQDRPQTGWTPDHLLHPKRFEAAPRMAALALLACVLFSGPIAFAGEQPLAKLRPVPFTEVKIQDSFWAPRRETNRLASIPFSLQKLEEAGNLEDMRLAGRGATNGFRGPVFMDSDLYKAL